VAREPGRVCVVMTADCLPVLLCDDSGGVVAAAHAGWRGLLDGVIEATVAAMRVPSRQVHAWLGPAIGPTSFEVGSEVRERFCAGSAQAEAGFVAGVGGRWFADLYLLARQRLSSIGVQRISGGEHCTFIDQERFFSYRRDGRTGRMASLIWMESPSRR
jgi:YfiH family protein